MTKISLAAATAATAVETRREHRTVHYRPADRRIASMLDLARSLLGDNAEHVAACRALQDR